MKTMKRTFCAICLSFCLALPVMVRASGIPVVDGANMALSIQNFMQQMEQMVKDYEMLTQQFDQAKEQFESMTGNRGFAGSWASSNPPIDFSKLLEKVSSDAQKYVQDMTQQAGSCRGFTGELLQNCQAEIQIIAKGRATSDVFVSAITERIRAINELLRMVDSADDSKGAMEVIAVAQAESVQLQNVLAQMQAHKMQVEEEAKVQEMKSHNRASAMIGSDPTVFTFEPVKW